MSGRNSLIPSRRDIEPAEDQEGNDDMPQALLEFHSPSAAVLAMPPRASARFITWVIGSMAVATIVGMCVLPLDRVVSADGRLISTRSTVLVEPIESAIVRRILVHEGQEVKKGEVLVELDPTISDADILNLRHQVDSYAAQVARLTAQAKGEEYVVDPNSPSSTQQAAIFLRQSQEYRAKLENYDQQIASQRSQLQGYLADAALFAGRVKVAQDVHAMRQQLLRDQVGSRLNSLASQDQLMEVQRSEAEARANAIATQNKLAALEAERDGYVQNTKATTFENLTDSQRHLFEARDDFAKADLRAHLTNLTAPEDSVVLTIAKVATGSVLQAGSEVMTLVPTDAPLEVEGIATAKDSGYLRLGDKANIKFATFPSMRYGGAQGTLVNVSADSFSEKTNREGLPESSGLNPVPTGASFYRLRIRIDKYTLHGVPNYFHPVPGMPVTADILVGKRTMMEFLLGSVMPVATEGMREP
ncbi:HlyD family secretion protein [Endobacter medicaginis]|uniref:Membrane fusion protein (MFP) family protein n=1 Tax=Endobacter medicaginis TaxID=1181271 RepID=A0A850NRF1_9PROT|nr:HlyD family type I secretion periplasmic adaptor subunit [Endobacter medicaginis]MBB3173121.1 HlyD family secretion protein [Endobacter medicaginis]MCX5474454.1 HlyD family type I secretion periplasmic adaptor subunit [Endobacter medicaginis]NVN30909.1 HlyD family type I secretion periplasmic adaptor subunit [Endobacter medicaginis]